MSEEDDAAQTQHQLTQAQLAAIENEIKSTQSLTSPLLPIGALLQHYENIDGGDDGDTSSAQQQQQQIQQQHRGFIQSATFLSKKYTSLRKIRGDGNCYYRAFLYSLSEHILRRLVNNNDNNISQYAEFRRLKDVVAKSLKWVCQYGYDEYTIDMFHEELVELFDFIEEVSKKPTSKEDANTDDMLENAMQQLHSKLNEENATSDYCTWFMRVMTAAQMKSNPDEYLPFLMAENYGDVPSFCAREVEPMGKECGMVQVSALAKCMGVKVVIEYMDGRMGVGGDEKLVHHVFGGGSDGNCNGAGEGEQTCITLLYRPGHYDILY
mmetsp:Transcript_1503/g.3187  ORF Transcript_1503/g.3187 Transcript_1503/m.3187 type:complete len:323 (+) Transcript_1503:69-1037(+)|eukprot:CAMPEP_0172314716 /NCGR_PEP_ID=MMETSP1058-20130122/23238_1 /TAXON_ID=83371 /ORGANISM="Detonula confervacea, Strain CCMP 353" /LENGTH=322 /DNA_ID=CAMNT_0013028655 /DNA_START=24 /DNA_END=992 /DNA_ORIENTATION=-